MALSNDAIAQKIFETLRDSAAILAKCQDLVAAPHAVCLGLSGEDGPPADYLPMFEVISWNKEKGQNPDSWPWAFSINIYLQDDSKTYDITANGVKTIVNRGPQSLEALMDLAQSATQAALPEFDFDDLSFEYDPITYFPLISGALNFNISFPKLIGGFLPSL